MTAQYTLLGSDGLCGFFPRLVYQITIPSVDGARILQEVLHMRPEKVIAHNGLLFRSCVSYQ